MPFLRYILPGILAALIALAGWVYLLNSSAARRLAAVENPVINLRRIRLRRFCGLVMMLLSICLFAGCYLVSESRGAFLAVWLAVMLLLLIVVALAMEDVRLTARLRRDRLRIEDLPKSEDH